MYVGQMSGTQGVNAAVHVSVVMDSLVCTVMFWGAGNNSSSAFVSVEKEKQGLITSGKHVQSSTSPSRASSPTPAWEIDQKRC